MQAEAFFHYGEVEMRASVEGRAGQKGTKVNVWAPGWLGWAVGALGDELPHHITLAKKNVRLDRMQKPIYDSFPRTTFRCALSRQGRPALPLLATSQIKRCKG